MSYVLDASAMLALLNGEAGGDLVQGYLDEGDVPVYAHILNLIEVFYDFSRGDDLLAARQTIADLNGGGIQMRDDMDVDLWEDAAQLKADWRRVSLADCFGVALTRRLGAEFVTCDRHELEKLQQADIANIIFIR